MQLTQKERLLLQDQMSHEKVCIQKYQDYANRAQDPRVKQMFSSHGEHEQQHLNTLNQMLNGQIPMTQFQQQSQQGGTQVQKQSSVQDTASRADSELCNDMLMTEKYVSGTYDTAVFEFTNSNMRQALNHIQKEEQQHGEAIFNYMQSSGFYNPQ